MIRRFVRARASAALLFAAVEGVVFAAEPVPLDPSLAAGVRVAVKLRIASDGAFVADTIEIRAEEARDEELRGRIERVDAPLRRFALLGFDVIGDETTRLSVEPEGTASWSDLVDGLRVKVDGVRDPQGRFLARAIRIRESQHDEMRMVGAIESIDAAAGDRPTLRLLGRPVALTGSTDLDTGRGLTRGALIRSAVIHDDDVTTSERGRVGPHLAFGGEARLTATSSIDPDLDGAEVDGETVGAAGAIGVVAADWERVRLFAEVFAREEYFFRGGDGLQAGNTSGEIDLTQGYVRVLAARRPTVLFTLGRQKFVDDREWLLYSRDLDGARVSLEAGRFAVEASISRDLLDDTENSYDREHENVIVQARYDAGRALLCEAIYLDRRDLTEVQDSPRILAIRLTGSPGRHVNYWADLAGEGGTRGQPTGCAPGLCLIRDVRAWAFDLGATVRPRVALDPSVTVSYAIGSGDATADLPQAEQPDGPVRAFRQGGLQRNRSAWNGVVSFRYYGEAFDPELTNLRILTLGVGVRPLRTVSIDAIYHRYRQDAATPHLHGSDVDARPSGLDPELGDAWDLIVGYEPRRALELRLTAGVFRPGPAFRSDGDGDPLATVQAYSVRFQSKFRF